jgi:hypothetical protein
MTHIGTSREAVEALIWEGVTEGPWYAEGDVVYCPRGMEIAELAYWKGARFIAASRQLVPALLDRAEKAEAELAALKAELAALKAERDGLRKALKPFAVALSLGRKARPFGDTGHIREIALAFVTLDHLKAANAALGDA